MSYSKTIKTIDLSAFVEKIMECKLPDGTTVNLKRPTKAIVLSLQGLAELADATAEEQYSAARALCVDILNNNKDKREFTLDDVADYPEEMLAGLMSGYRAFINALISDPNS